MSKYKDVWLKKRFCFQFLFSSEYMDDNTLYNMISTFCDKHPFYLTVIVIVTIFGDFVWTVILHFALCPS